MHQLIFSALLAVQAPTERAPNVALEAISDAYTHALFTQLRQSPSPRDRALVSRMLLIDEPAAGARLLHDAARAAPSDAVVQMLWATAGSRWSGCPISTPCPEQGQAWARAEPDNGMALIVSFEATLAKSADERQIDAAIARIAGASRYDDHLLDAWNGYRLAFAGRPMPPALVEAVAEDKVTARRNPDVARKEAEAIMAMSYAAALPFPMVSLSRACRRASHPEVAGTRFEDCARIGRGILESDSSLMAKSIGAAILRVSESGDEADRDAIRRLAWLRESVPNLLEEREYRQYFEDLAATGSEIRTMELLMSRHGVSIVPPADWKARE